MNKIYLFLISISTLFASQIEVSVVQAIPKIQSINVDVDGVIVAKKKYAISSKSSGILNLYVSDNSRLHVGDKIAYISDERRIKKLELLKSKVSLKKSEISSQKLKLQDAKAMYEMGVGSKNSYLTQEISLKQVEASYKNLQNDYEILNIEEKNAHIYSKVDGYILNLRADGSYIDYGMLIADINTEDTVIKLFVDAKYADNIIRGQRLTLKGEYKNISGSVLDVLYKSKNNLVEVMAKVDKALILGLHVRADIHLKKFKGLSLPKDSLVLIENHPAVYIIRDGVAHLKFVDIIKDKIDTVLIKDSLDIKAQIALKNAYMLHDNLEVVVK
jgi:hypothetical protein